MRLTIFVSLLIAQMAMLSCVYFVQSQKSNTTHGYISYSDCFFQILLVCVGLFLFLYVYILSCNIM